MWPVESGHITAASGYHAFLAGDPPVTSTCRTESGSALMGGVLLVADEHVGCVFRPIDATLTGRATLIKRPAPNALTPLWTPVKTILAAISVKVTPKAKLGTHYRQECGILFFHGFTDAHFHVVTTAGPDVHYSVWISFRRLSRLKCRIYLPTDS